ncbi:chemotaxis protein CheW [Sulfuriferula sp. AH1]|uniref:chemotaxis protein CheW n=1 Tax=Sulfuriferula sp. AH1 TaxID=1985873 RepID=UPI000B3B73B3|nr:chemotaxis protein CheW [Sulfuriferula sp. AH1]ARU32181.1 chemotaxis protein CheW [Sulfuriferula sp. AH1]
MNNTDKTAPQKTGKRVNWSEVKQRLEAAQVAIDRIWMPTPEDTQKTLQARAQALAREVLPAEAADAGIEVIEFLLAHERYAIASECVREVYPLEELTPLPCTPAFVLGIINVRGEILSVIDIKKFFDLPEKGLTDLNKVIVLESADMRFGIVADVISGVRRIMRADIQSSLPTLTGIREDYLLGVTSERVVILDAGKLLSDEKLIVQEQVGD